MKFTTDKKSFKEAIARIANVADKKSTVAVLGFIRIRAADAHVTLTATDLEMQASVTIPADVVTPGETMAPAENLIAISRNLRGDIEITHTGDKITAKSGSAKFTLPTLNPADFPEFAPLAADGFTVSGAEFSRIMGEAIIAHDASGTRPNLEGVHLTCGNELLTAVATNGQIMAVSSIPFTGEIEAITVPVKATKEIISLAGSSEGVHVATDGNRLLVRSDNGEVLTKLLGGDFPDWRRILPRSDMSTATVGIKDLRDAVNAASSVTDGKINIVSLAFDDDRVHVSGRGGDNRTATDEIPAVIEGDNLTVSYNAKYILGAVSAVDAGEFVIHYQENGPTKFAPVGMENTFYLVMPLRS